MKTVVDMRKACLFTIVTSLLISCEPAFEPIIQFRIAKGDHYASPRLVESMQSTTLVFQASFDESAKYNFNDQALQTNKNKLMGFADCNSVHHENSARFAWQWFNNQLEIYAYCYVNGNREEKFLGVVELDKFNRYEIKIMDDRYLFRLNDNEPVEMRRGITCDAGVYYKLWPYFGGSLPAPHSIKIDVKPSY